MTSHHNIVLMTSHHTFACNRPTISTANDRFILLVKSDLIVRVLKRIGQMFGYVVPDFLGNMLGSFSYVVECMWWLVNPLLRRE